MNRKIVKPVAITAGVVLLVGGIAALATGVSYHVSGGGRTLWSVKLMEKSGLEGYLARRVQKKAHKDD